MAAMRQVPKEYSSVLSALQDQVVGLKLLFCLYCMSDLGMFVY